VNKFADQSAVVSRVRPFARRRLNLNPTKHTVRACWWRMASFDLSTVGVDATACSVGRVLVSDDTNGSGCKTRACGKERTHASGCTRGREDNPYNVNSTFTRSSWTRWTWGSSWIFSNGHRGGRKCLWGTQRSLIWEHNRNLASCCQFACASEIVEAKSNDARSPLRQSVSFFEGLYDIEESRS